MNMYAYTESLVVLFIRIAMPIHLHRLRYKINSTIENTQHCYFGQWYC